MQESSKTIFKQTSIYGVGSIFKKLGGVIILPLMKSYTSDDEFGVWMLLETIFLFIMVVSAFGVKSGFTRWFYDMESKRDKKSLFFTSFMFNVFSSILVTLLFGIFLFHYSYLILKLEVSNELIVVFLVAGLFRLLHELPFVLLRLKQSASKQTVHATINVLMLIAFTFYYLEYRNEGFVGVFWAQLWANMLTLVFLFPVIYRNSVGTLLVSKLKDMLNYGLPLAFSGFLTIILNLSDRHIINQFYTPAESGNFGLSVKVSNLLEMIVITSFITAYTYYYYKSLRDKESLAIFNKIQRYFFIILSFAGLGVVLFAKEIIWVVSAGDQYYQEGVYIVPFLVMGLMFSGLRQFFTLPLNKHKQTQTISKILILAGVLNIGLNILFVPNFGKIGAAWATLIVQFCSFLVFYFVSNKIETLNFNFPQASKVVILWSCIGAISFVLPTGLVLGIGLKVILWFLYGLSLVVFGILNKSDLIQLKKTALMVLKN